jgi:hypothetical protein
MNQAELRLSYKPDDDGHGQLDAVLVSGAFAGRGAAWFSRQYLLDVFIPALRVFPLAADSLPRIEGGFWRNGNLGQCHLRISIRPHGNLGSLLVHVDLAGEAFTNPDHDEQQSLTARFMIEYAALEPFADEFTQVLDGTREAAVLFGSRK